MFMCIPKTSMQLKIAHLYHFHEIDIALDENIESLHIIKYGLYLHMCTYAHMYISMIINKNLKAYMFI